MGYARSYARPSRDDNHGAVVDALEAAGCFVIDLGAVGGGVPDLFVARHGFIHVLEVKNADTHARRARGEVPHFELLTDEQIDFLARYGSHGPRVHIVTTPDEALAAVGASKSPAGKESP